MLAMAERLREFRLIAQTNFGAPQPPCGVVSVIGADLKIVGTVACRGALEIDGTVEGEINAQSVSIGEYGQVDGSLVAQDVSIDGSLRGAVKAISVSIGRTAQVDANITHNALDIEPGAFVIGRRPWRPLPQGL